MTNPNNAIGTNAAYSGRTSANAFNDVLSVLSRGIVSGWACSPDTGMSVVLGGDGTTRDVAIAEDNIGNRTTINNISGAPVSVTIGTAPLANSRIDLIVAYVDNPPEGTSTITDNYEACGLIVVQGTASASPTAPNDSDIRTAITTDGGSGVTAYYVILAEIAVASGTTVIDGSLITQGGNAGITGNNIQDETIVTNKFSQYAVNKAVFAGKNLAPASDTVADWINLFGGTLGDYGAGKGGYWVNYYNETNKFTNQPAEYGWLETIIEGINIYQRWTTHTGGPVYYRTGNRGGWAPSSGIWRRLDDSYHAGDTVPLYGCVGLITVQENSQKAFLTIPLSKTSNASVVTLTSAEANTTYGFVIDGDNVVHSVRIAANQTVTGTMTAQGALFQVNLSASSGTVYATGNLYMNDGTISFS